MASLSLNMSNLTTPTDVNAIHDGSYTKEKKKKASRGHWRPGEDSKLRDLVAIYGPQNWNLIAERLPGRSGKSCRLRWFNQLDPRINRRAFTEEEEERLMGAHRLYGNKWAMLARLFPGRTDNAVKNHWHVIMARNSRRILHHHHHPISSSPSPSHPHSPSSSSMDGRASEEVEKQQQHGNPHYCCYYYYYNNPMGMAISPPSSSSPPFIDFLGVGVGVEGATSTSL